MKIENKQVVELIGILAVVASLIFVGIQLYLDRELALATQYASRAESVKSDLRSQMESDVFMSAEEILWSNGDRPSWWTDQFEQENRESGLSGAQSRSMIARANIGILQLDNLYFQYERGFITEEFWTAVRENLKNGLRVPLTRAIWVNRSPRLPISEVIDEVIEELESEN